MAGEKSITFVKNFVGCRFYMSEYSVVGTQIGTMQKIRWRQWNPEKWKEIQPGNIVGVQHDPLISQNFAVLGG